jgi:site-specific recombinase XerD
MGRNKGKAIAKVEWAAAPVPAERLRAEANTARAFAANNVAAATRRAYQADWKMFAAWCAARGAAALPAAPETVAAFLAAEATAGAKPSTIARRAAARSYVMVPTYSAEHFRCLRNPSNRGSSP